MRTWLFQPTLVASAILLGICFQGGPSSAGSCATPGFAAARSFDTGGNAQSVAVGDFNSDGVPDLAVANSGSEYVPNSRVSTLLGNGEGTFQAAVDYQAGTAPVSVAVGDFNRDGKLDLAVANAGYWALPPDKSNVSVLLGNGDGTFQAAVSFATGPESVSVAVADFNSDGKLDLAVANRGSVGADSIAPTNGSVSLLLGKGDGTFAAAVNSAVDFGATWDRPDAASAGMLIVGKVMAVGDLNGDGKPDLALVKHDLGIVSVLLGKGDGTFLPAMEQPVGSRIRPASLTLSDWNGDGKLDLALANSNPDQGDAGSLSVLIGQDNGTFQSAVEYPSTMSDESGAFGAAVFLAAGNSTPRRIRSNVSSACASRSDSLLTFLRQPSQSRVANG